MQGAYAFFHILDGMTESERNASSSLHTKKLSERLRTEMPAADRDLLQVEQCSEIERMNPFDMKCDDRTFFRCCTENAESRKSGEFSCGVLQQLRFLGSDLPCPYLFDELDGL